LRRGRGRRRKIEDLKRKKKKKKRFGEEKNDLGEVGKRKEEKKDASVRPLFLLPLSTAGAREGEKKERSKKGTNCKKEKGEKKKGRGGEKRISCLLFAD